MLPGDVVLLLEAARFGAESLDDGELSDRFTALADLAEESRARA